MAIIWWRLKLSKVISLAGSKVAVVFLRRRIAHVLARNRQRLAIVLLVASVFMFYRALQVEFSYRFEHSVPEDHPFWQKYREFVRLFGQEGSSVFVGTVVDSPFGVSFLRSWYIACEQVRRLPGVEEVLSITTLPIVEKDTVAKRLLVRRVMEHLPASREDARQLAERASRHPFRRYVLNDSAVFATIILDDSLVNSPVRPHLLARIRDIFRQVSALHGVKMHFGGIAFVREWVSSSIKRELWRLVLLSGGVSVFLLLVFLRSVWLTVFAMVTAGLSVIWALAWIDLLGLKVNLLTGMSAPLLIVIVVPNAVYMLMRYYNEWHKVRSSVLAWVLTYERVGMAMVGTYLTTAIGFFSFAFSGSKLMSEFGVVSGLGVLSAFVLTVGVLPFLLSITGRDKREGETRLLRVVLMGRVLHQLSWIATRASRRAIALWLLVVVVSMVLMRGIQLGGYMRDDLPGRQFLEDVRFFERNLGGVLPVTLVLHFRKGKVFSLSALREVDNCERVLTQTFGGGVVLSVADVVKYGVQELYGGRPEHFRLPTPMELSFWAPYLRGHREDNPLVRQMVDSTGTFTRIIASVPDIGARQFARASAQLEQTLLQKVDTSQVSFYLTGTGVLFMASSLYIVEGLLKSLAISAVCIGCILLLVTGSVRLSLLILLSNGVALVVLAGVMGLLGIKLTPATALVFSVALGIAVDSGIHIAIRFLQEKRFTGGGVRLSMQNALSHTGYAVLVNTCVLMAGFGVLALSSFSGTRLVGELLAVTFVIAALVNLTLLPAGTVVLHSAQE